MSDRWIHQREILLKTIEKVRTKKDRDRLDLINSMLLALNALDQSVHGWLEWILNLDFMSQFSIQELQEMETGLVTTVHNFIEYDIGITKQHENKIPRIRFRTRKKKKEDEPAGMFV